MSKKLPENHSPWILGPTAINVTIGQQVSVTLIGGDQDGDNVTVTLVTDLPANAAYFQWNSTLVWTPSSLAEESIT